MKIGCHLPTQGPVATRDALLTFASAAEARGIDSLWVSDHVVFPHSATGQYPGGTYPFPPDTAYLEPVTALAAAAMCTSRARLGCSVFILGHRHPVLMAKMLATIDTLSNGRLICGVGVGWWKEELELLGAPYHERGRHADEALRIFKELWTSDKPEFAGAFHRFGPLGFGPRPVQKPHPPIWVGGDSAGAFRRVVQLGDGWHASSKTPEQMRACLERLRAAADRAHRDFATLAISARVRLPPELPISDAELIERLAQYKALGLSDLMLDFRRDDLGAMLELLDRVATQIRPALERA